MFQLPNENISELLFLNALIKITLLLAFAWLVYYAIPAKRVQWRVVGWRVFAVSLLCLPFLSFFTPKYSVAVFDSQPASLIDASADPSSTGGEAGLETADSSRIHIKAQENNRLAPFKNEPTAQTSAGSGKRTIQSMFGFFEDWLAAFLVIWFLGAVVFVIRILYHQYYIIRDISDSQLADASIQELFQRYALDAGCRRNIKVRLSSKTEVPYIYGCFFPMIILPERMSAREYKNDLPSIFVHELSHVRNNDLVWMACFRFLQAFLWVHPLVWGMRSAHEKACEQASDERAAFILGDNDLYAGTLAKIALEISTQSYSINAAPMVRSSKIASRLKLIDSCYASVKKKGCNIRRL